MRALKRVDDIARFELGRVEVSKVPVPSNEYPGVVWGEQQGSAAGEAVGARPRQPVPPACLPVRLRRGSRRRRCRHPRSPPRSSRTARSPALRHSAATHLGEAEIPLQLIMGKTPEPPCATSSPALRPSPRSPRSWRLTAVPTDQQFRQGRPGRCPFLSYLGSGHFSAFDRSQRQRLSAGSPPPDPSTPDQLRGGWGHGQERRAVYHSARWIGVGLAVHARASAGSCAALSGVSGMAAAGMSSALSISERVGPRRAVLSPPAGWRGCSARPPGRAGERRG
jgi:hypothetical protein